MFKIAILKGGSADKYYVHLNEVDGYYTKKEEPPGRWHGKGAEALKIWGMVRADQFKELMNGRCGDRQLVQNVGKEGRVKGFDCVIAPPKSVSVVWALGNKEDRAAIDRAFSRVKDSIIDRMEATVRTRSGRGGLNKSEGAKLIVGAFRHDTNRANEPSIHYHLVVINAAVRVDGTTSTPDFSRVFKNQRAISNEFRRELARELRREGFSTRQVLAEDEKGKRYSSFELRDVPVELVSAFSRRSDEIKRLAKEQGVNRSLINLRTRERKEPIDRSRLDASWRQIAIQHGKLKDGKLAIRQNGIGENEALPERYRNQTSVKAESRIASTAAHGAAVLLAGLKGKVQAPKQIDGIERTLERKYESDVI